MCGLVYVVSPGLPAHIALARAWAGYLVAFRWRDRPLTLPCALSCFDVWTVLFGMWTGIFVCF
jgi:hypothetical protein